MNFLHLLFVILILSAFCIIFSKNPIHSILFLVLTFVGTTFLFILLSVEFLAVLFLVVYVGAIAVLFLFVIMMLNIKIIELNEKIIKYLPIGLFIIIFLLYELLILISSNSTINIEYNYFINYTSFINIIDTYSNIENIAEFLYTKYVYLFIIASLILLVSMIGAILLTLNQNFVNKRQNITFQINTKLTDSIKLLKTNK